MASGYADMISGSLPFSKKLTTHHPPPITPKASAEKTGQEMYGQDFALCSGTLPEGWTHYSVAGAQVWSCTVFGRSNNGVQANGFAGTAQANEDWLLSPAFDLSGFDIPLLQYWCRSRFAGLPLRLLVSVDYSGSGDPHAPGVNWTEVAGQFAPVDSDVWTQARDIDLSAFKQPRVFVAFVYTSTSEAASRWTLDDFSLIDSPIGAFQTSLQDLADLDFGTVLAPDESAASTFAFTVTGLDTVLTLSAPAGFLLSKNGQAYAGRLDYTPAEAAAPNTVYLKFKPAGTASTVYAGTIGFAAGREWRTTAGYLSGNTVPQTETFDVVNWNIEWFGAANGPADNALQLAHVKKVVESLDAEVYVLQEISNQPAFSELLRQLPGYQGFTSPYVSGGSGSNAQRLAFLYKTAAVDSVGGRALLTGADQPPDFWASGRLPYLFIFDARVNGAKKRIHLVNIHPKANENNSPADALEAYERRRFDVQVLKDSLDVHYAEVCLLVAGDFNDDLDFTVAAVPASESTFKPFVEDSARYQAITLPLSQAGLRSYLYFENVIDHVLISDEMQASYLDRSARIVIPFDLVSDYANTTSDHLPVSSRFLLSPEVISGRADPALAAGLRVFPNPAKASLQVTLAGSGPGTTQIALYDLSGRLVFRQVVQTKENDLSQLIPVAHLPRNGYLLQITTPRGLVSQRIFLSGE